MKVLVVGSGGREHALCWKIAQSPLVKKLYCAPGNPGTAALADNVPIAAEDVAGLVQFAQQERIDLCVVGPEAPLCLGLVDELQKVGRLCFGLPRSKAARPTPASCAAGTASLVRRFGASRTCSRRVRSSTTGNLARSWSKPRGWPPARA